LLFNLRCLQAHLKTKEKQVRKLLFTDDAVFVAHTDSDMQRITSQCGEFSSLDLKSV